MGRSSPGRFLRRCRALGLFAVAVEAAAALAPQQPPVHQLLLHQGGQEPGVVVEGGEDGRGDRVVDVLADQVHQFKGSHAEPAGLAHDGVQRGAVGRALFERPQRLGVEGARDPVDDEARGGAGDHGPLAPGAGRLVDGLHGLGVGGEAPHHLDQLHHRRGVEEVHAHQPPRVIEPGGDGRDRKRRGVGGEQGIRRADALQLAEERALGRQVLHDRLHHQPGGGDVAQVVDGANPGERLVAPRLGQLSAGDEPCQPRADLLNRAFHHLAVGVEQQGLVARRRGDLGDAGAHGAGADHRDPVGTLESSHGCHSPLKSASRFSMKAATPSR